MTGSGADSDRGRRLTPRRRCGMLIWMFSLICSCGVLWYFSWLVSFRRRTSGGKSGKNGFRLIRVGLWWACWRCWDGSGTWLTSSCMCPSRGGSLTFAHFLLLPNWLFTFRCKISYFYGNYNKKFFCLNFMYFLQLNNLNFFSSFILRIINNHFKN